MSTRRQARWVITVSALVTPGLMVASPAAAVLRAGMGPARQAAPFAGQRGAVARTIFTVAGGTGGPGKATAVPLAAGNNGVCSVSFISGAMYVGDRATVRRVTLHTGWLTSPVGSAADPFMALGDGGPAKDATGGMCNVTADHSGNLVLADGFNERVRVAAAHTGTFYGQAMTSGDIYTLAGNGTQGFAGDGGPATGAEFVAPGAVAVDRAGNLAITDVQNLRVRMVAAHTGRFYGQAMTAGDIYTIAGTGELGFSGDGGPATSAEISVSGGIAEDAAGNLVLTDSGNSRIRVIAAHTGTFYGQAMTAGDIYTIAGDGTGGFAGDGGPATSAELLGPGGTAQDAAGNLVLADSGNSRIRVIAAHTGTFYGQAMTAGDIYTVAGNGTQGFAGDGGPATQAKVNLPSSVAVDSAGNLLVADNIDGRVRVVAATNGTFYGLAVTAGDIYTAAGNGLTGEGDNGPALKAQFGGTQGVAVDAAGNWVFGASQRVKVIAAHTGTFYGRAMAAGNIYSIAGNGKFGFSGDRGPATKATLYNPVGVVLDGAGNVLIANSGRPRVRVVAEKTGTFYGQAMAAGDIYTIAGSGKVGFVGDGQPALGAKFWNLSGIALDGAGNVLLADAYRIRVVPVSTGTFYGQAMTAGDIYTVAGLSSVNGGGFSGDGGPATKAKLLFPGAVTVDGAGNLVIADSGNSRIRVVAVKTGTFYGRAMIGGNIYTVAGNGKQGFAGDGGPAKTAEVNQPEYVAIGGSGNLVIADTFNSAIRVAAVTNGTFYGRAMMAGHIYTVAGTGSPGFSGDSGPAACAHLDQPWAVTADGPGSLVISDTGNVRIRFMAG